jgi:hypothetical protein
VVKDYGEDPFSKNCGMKPFISKMFLIVDLVLIAKCINAQNYNDYRDAEAVMLRVNGSAYSETKLKDVIVVLPNYSNQLIVRLNIPYSFLNEEDTDDTIGALSGFPLHMRIKMDPWKIQESLTSDKTFDTDGFLTLNHITKLVTVEYTPLPSQTSQDGGFNLNVMIGFNPLDFNLSVGGTDTRFFIKIGDAPVNRL